MNLSDIIERVRSYNPAAQVDLIVRAYDFAETMHKGQHGVSGKSCFAHPIEVAGIITELRLDIPSVVTGLLHGTVEDSLAPLNKIESLFGTEIAALVDGVTKIGQISFSSREKKQAENFRKMLVAMARDLRVILITLADRTHVMRTLDLLSFERQRDIAQEALDIYVPLAHRCGINWIKSELEDNALRSLRPDIYYQLQRKISMHGRERGRYVQDLINALQKRLDENGIEAEIIGRANSLFAIYQKLQSQNRLCNQMEDLTVFCILVDSVRDCYDALGIVHASLKPVSGRVEDYIALPKANMYQSLHTTVIGPYGERAEVQIRTQEMHRIAESGIAAHWRHETDSRFATADAQRFTWLQQALEWQQNLQDPTEFLRSVKEDLFTAEVFVFTPKGDLLNFPEGSSVIDFAYRIHSDIGHHCTGAYISGRVVPPRYRLRSGDTVEIITTPNQIPGKDWLPLVRTVRARKKVRSFIKDEGRKRSIEVGRGILERDLSSYRLSLAGLRKEMLLAQLLADFSLRDEDALLASIGDSRINSERFLAKLWEYGNRSRESKPRPVDASPGDSAASHDVPEDERDSGT